MTDSGIHPERVAVTVFNGGIKVSQINGTDVDDLTICASTQVPEAGPLKLVVGNPPTDTLIYGKDITVSTDDALDLGGGDATTVLRGKTLHVGAAGDSSDTVVRGETIRLASGATGALHRWPAADGALGQTLCVCAIDATTQERELRWETPVGGSGFTARKWTVKTDGQTLTEGDDLCVIESAGVTVNLPAVGAGGAAVQFIRVFTDGHAVTVSGAGSDTIHGEGEWEMGANNSLTFVSRPGTGKWYVT